MISYFLEHFKQPSRFVVAASHDGSEAAYLASKGHSVIGIDCNSEKITAANQKFGRLGLKLEFIKKDIRFYSPEVETFDGIFCNRLASALNPDEVKRVLISFFKGLSPRTGKLLIAHIEASSMDFHGKQIDTKYHYDSNAFQALLRQSGFQLLSMARQVQNQQTWVAYFCSRNTSTNTV